MRVTESSKALALFSTANPPHRQALSSPSLRLRVPSAKAGASVRRSPRRQAQRRDAFAPLADFLERIATDCPHELFSREGDGRVEIPIWLEERDIAALESRWEHHTHAERARPSAPSPTTSISCRLGTAPSMFSDYKPDAHRQARSRDLRSTSLALSHLTGIPLIDSKCAWFNGQQYSLFADDPRATGAGWHSTRALNVTFSWISQYIVDGGWLNRAIF